MRIISVANAKGGTAKTTTTVSVAVALAELGRRVLVVDLDPQAHASGWLGGPPHMSLANALGGDGDLAPQEVAEGGVELIPSPGRKLAGVERTLPAEPGYERILGEKLAALPDRWDYCLLDCPPSIGPLTISALTAAGSVLVPVEASALALAGLASFLQTIEQVKARLNPSLTIEGILICRVDRRTALAREVSEALRSQFGSLVFETQIRATVRLQEASAHHESIFAYDGRGNGAVDYRNLAAELEGRHG